MARTETLKGIFLNSVSCMDALAHREGKLTILAISMSELPTDYNIKSFIRELANCKQELGLGKETKVVVQNVNDALLRYMGRLKLNELNTVSADSDTYEESLESLNHKLKSLIGLESVKSSIDDLIAYHKVQRLRKEKGYKIPVRTLHLAFLGNPGTGKTTVARIVGKMYKQLGLLSKGHFIEVSRTDLIAGYQGQTALKVKNVIERAKGGVLFIDEAYSLTENEHSDSYGRECLTELTKALEDYRDDLVVIVAGYTDLMKNFFESNPGLKSRFNKFIEFGDYDSNELVRIFIKMCQEDDYMLSHEAKDTLDSIVRQGLESQKDNFANGRYVRNLYEDIIMNHAKRMNLLHDYEDKDLQMIKIDDLADFDHCHNHPNPPSNHNHE